METPSIHFKPTDYGFQYGSVEIERMVSDAKAGWVVLRVSTPKGNGQLYVTKTGKVRFSMDGVEWGPKE